MIAPCECKNGVQDKLHGKGLRVWNERMNGGRRCSSCGKEAGENKKK